MLEDNIVVDDENKKESLQKLVDELLKQQPRTQLVRQLTTELGMPYSIDPVTQMNTVLKAMNSVYFRPSRKKSLER